MKKLSILIFAILLHSIKAHCQTAAQAIPYQAIARDSSGAPMPNRTLEVRLTLHDGNISGAIDYEELDTVITNKLGLFVISFGEGYVVSGNFNTIDWSDGLKFMQVELDTGGSSFLQMGTTQLLSVPYALYATNINNAWQINGNTGTTYGTDYLGTTDAKKIAFDTKGTTAITIDTFQNIGMGTVSPAAKLDVDGNMHSLFNTSSKTSYIEYQDYSTETMAELLVDSLDAEAFAQQNGENPNYVDVQGTNILISVGNGHLQIEDGTEGENKVLTSDTFGNTSWGTLSAANVNAWGLSGNSGTAIGTNFIGTTDSNDLEFRINNQKAGIMRFDSSKSTSYGYQSLQNENHSFLILGNSAIGYQASQGITSGIDNVSIGYIALSTDTSGNSNTAIGTAALLTNKSGSSNTAIGAGADVAGDGIHGGTALGIAAIIRRNNEEIHSDSTFEVDYGNDTRFVLNNKLSDSLQFKFANSKWNITATNDTLSINNVKRLQYQDGNQAIGKVLTSDGSGNATWQGGFSGTTAGGDLSGTYPNPTVANINGVALGSTTASAGNVLIGSGSQWVTKAITGDVSVTSAGATTVGAINGATLGTTTATNGNILVANGSQWRTESVSGDMTINNTGVTTVATVSGNNVPQELLKTDSTSRTLAHGGTNVLFQLASAPALGTYGLPYYINLTANTLSTSCTSINVEILFTDENSTAQTITMNQFPLSTTGFFPGPSPVIKAKSGSQITVELTNSCSAGSATYDSGGGVIKY